MLTNTSITIYHREHNPKIRLDQWKRIHVKEAWWYKNEKSYVSADGLKQEDIITIRIPNIGIAVSKDDYVVKGICSIDMKTVKDLTGKEFAKITSANVNLFGANPHVKVVGI